MDFLNKAYSQITDLLRSMTPGARITACLLLLVVVVSLAFLFRYGSSTSGIYLYGGRDFSHSELAAMETAFAKAGLSQSEIVANRMRVPSAQKADYMAALLDGNALPARPYSFLSAATSDANPFVSSKIVEAKLHNARQQELALIISRMQDIEFATVHYDEVDKPGFPRRTERTATVAVQAVGNNHLEEERVLAIRNLVAAAYAGMKPTNVTVTDINGGSYPGGGEDGMGGGLDDAYASTKARYESSWRRKIVETLRWVPGVIVGVNVELDKELLREELRLKVNPTEVVSLSTKDDTMTSTTSSNTRGGRPGAVPNGVSNQAATIANGAGTTSETTENHTENTSFASRDHISTKIPGLTPSAVTATIGIPNSFYKRIWHERNPVAEGEEPKEPTPDDIRTIETEITTKVQEVVIQLLPSVPKSEDRFPRVAVKTLPDLPTTTPAEPGIIDNATAWLAVNWQALGMVLVALFGLLILRGMIRSTPSIPVAGAGAGPVAGAEPAPSIQLAEEDEEQTGTPTSEPRPRKRRFQATESTLKDDLIDIVREDTEAAAKVIRSWIGDAA